MDKMVGDLAAEQRRRQGERSKRVQWSQYWRLSQWYAGVIACIVVIGLFIWGCFISDDPAIREEARGVAAGLGSILIIGFLIWLSFTDGGRRLTAPLVERTLLALHRWLGKLGEEDNDEDSKKK